MIDSWDSATKLLASAFSDIDVYRGDGELEIKNDTDANFSHQNHPQVREESWLMRWKERNESSVNNRIANRKDTKSRDGRSTRKVFTDISLESYVTEERVPKDVYFVTLNAPNGVGMNLFVSYEGLVLVQGLYKLRNGSSSPAQNCGVIAVGDQLVQLNDINIEALSFYETTDLLKDLDLLAKDKIITLGFRYMDAPVFLPAEHEEPQRKANHEDVPVSELELSHDQSVPIETNLENIQNVMSLRQSPMVEDAFLALFALDEAEGFGMLPSTRTNARARPDPTPFTSELDTLQQQMRQQHMYPTAARVSALSGTAHPAALLHEVAEEVYEWRPVQLCRQYAGYYTPRAVSDSNTAHGAVLSGLIVTPQDTAVYQNTQQLVWCEENHCYVEPPSRLATVPETFVDNADCMKAVLQTLESEYLQKLTDSVQNPALKEDGVKVTPGSTKTTTYNAKQTIGAPQTVSVGNKGQSTIIIRGTSIVCDTTSSKCIVKPTVYNMSSMVPTKKQPYYYLKQSDFISKEHSSVQQLLSLPSAALLNKLSTIVDSAMENISSMNTTQNTTNTDNPFHNAKYYETHTEISIPPMLLTYQLLYSAQHLKPILLQNETFLSILERWATTFDLKGILHALEAQAKRKNSTEQVNIRSLSPAGTSASRAPHDAHKKKEFLVYFNNDPHTVRNLQPFVDVIKELLTFLLVCRVSPSIVRITKSSSGSGGLMEYARTTSGDTSSATTSLGKSFRLLPVTLDLVSTTAISMTSVDSSDNTYPDMVAASCIRKFGLLLFLDTIAVSASSAQYTRTLQAAIDAAGLDNTYCDCTHIMQQLLAKSVGTMLSAQQLIDQLSGNTNKNLESTKSTTSDRSSTSCSYLLCLLLQHLDTIFAQNTQLALDLTTLLYPLISPWNVQHTLFPPEDRDNTENNEESTGRGAQNTINALDLTVMRQSQGIGVSSSVNTSTATSLSSSTVPSPAASPRTTSTGKIDASMLSPLLPPMPPLQSPPLLSLTSPQSVQPLPVTLPIQKAGNKVQLSSQTERELDRLLSRTSSNHSMLSTATAPAATTGSRNGTSSVSSKALHQAPRAPQVPQHSLQGGLCAQNAYYGYLTRLFRMHTSLGQNAPVLVLSWLETALSLAHQDKFHAGNDAFSVHASVYATPKGKKKNPFAITVRNLLHSPEQYCMDAVAAMELCMKYCHLEGVVTLCERLIQCDTTSTVLNTSDETLQLHPTDLSIILNVLTQAGSKQVSAMLALVNQIHESEVKSKQASIVTSSNRSEAYQSISASANESPELESFNSMCSICTLLLRQLLLTARALCQHQQRVDLRDDPTSSQSFSFLARRFESPEWSIFGDILNTIALEQFYELPAQTGVVYDRLVLGCVSNMLGECVRFAVGTEGALLTLQHAPVLVDLITC